MIPTIDLDDIRQGPGAARERCVEVLGKGLCEFGFLTVDGHGVDLDLVRRVYAHFETFFRLDEAVKSRYAGREGARGFTPFGVERAKGRQQADLKEFFHVGQELESDHPLFSEYAPNVWPEEVPELRDDSLALYRSLEACASTILEALAEYFDLPPATFRSMMEAGNSVLRAIHYPPVPADLEPGSLRAAEHEDINLITLLPEATDSGLEILTRDGSWLPVKAEEGQFVVDAGDMLSRVTNGVVPATTHRVVNPPTGMQTDRFSMPFFVHAYPSCDLTVLEHFVSDERPAAFPPTTAGEFLRERMREIGLLGS